MKILFLYQDIESGAKLSTEAIISTLKKTYPSDVYISYKQPSQKFKGHFSYFINLCWSITNYYKIIKKTDADIIYSVMFTSALSYILSFEKSVPFVFHLHGDQKFGLFDKRHTVLDLFRYPYFIFLNSFIIFLQTLALKTARKVIFVSSESATEIINNYHLQGKVSPVVIENGVDQTRFKPLGVQEKILVKKNLINSNNFLISYLGRIDEKKGVLNLIKAISLIDPAFLNSLTILLAFPKPIDDFSIKLLQKIKIEAKKNGLEKMVILKQNFSKLEKICQVSDLVVLPSTQEMLPLVMLESLSSGSLFLSTRVGHVPTVLKRISTSLLMSNNEPETIAKHIQYFITIKPNKKMVILQKAQKVIQKYTWEKTSQKLYLLFTALYTS